MANYHTQKYSAYLSGTWASFISCTNAHSRMHVWHVKNPSLKYHKFWVMMVFPRGFVNMFACGSSSLTPAIHSRTIHSSTIHSHTIHSPRFTPWTVDSQEILSWNNLLPVQFTPEKFSLDTIDSRNNWLPRQFTLWTVHSQDSSLSGQFTPRTVHSWDNSLPRQFTPETIRSQDNSLVLKSECTCSCSCNCCCYCCAQNVSSYCTRLIKIM